MTLPVHSTPIAHKTRSNSLETSEIPLQEENQTEPQSVNTQMEQFLEAFRQEAEKNPNKMQAFVDKYCQSNTNLNSQVPRRTWWT